MNTRRRTVALIACATAVLITVGGCSFDKVTEPFQDAPRTGTVNNGAADVITMPDGFSNVSTKCDHNNRLYVAFHGDSPYAAFSVVADDPTCKR